MKGRRQKEQCLEGRLRRGLFFFLCLFVALRAGRRGRITDGGEGLLKKPGIINKARSLRRQGKVGSVMHRRLRPDQETSSEKGRKGVRHRNEKEGGRPEAEQMFLRGGFHVLSDIGGVMTEIGEGKAWS